MNPWRPILARARAGLIALGAALALGLMLVLGSQFWHERVRGELTRSQSELAAQQAALSTRQADLDNIQSHINQFKQLAQRGLIGTPDREGWVEQLVASHQRTGLPASLSYTLNAPKLVSQQDTTAAPAADTAPDANTSEPQFHDLEFGLKGIHEEELLALLQDFGTHAKGRFRVNACQLTERSPQGLSAQCVLRFFTLPQTSPAAAAS